MKPLAERPGRDSETRKNSAVPSLFFAMIAFFVFAIGLDGISPTGVSGDTMKGPTLQRDTRAHSPDGDIPFVHLVSLGAIRFYQDYLSPIRGDRCGFRPSCSAYGHEAVRSQGFLLGVTLIGDRMTRCNIWKKPDAHYYLLPNGRLFDPLSSNLLFVP